MTTKFFFADLLLSLTDHFYCSKSLKIVAAVSRNEWCHKNWTGENLKVVWAENSTLSSVVFALSVNAWHTQPRTHLELKTRPRFRPLGYIIYS
jgi:hypothetical protein